ncbi:MULTISPECIES: Hsp70 family protein [unclassified Pseudonocardia]|uniref:Hsp70 family protein n=1 Tax=unclassified Pseudonocardia TaxID=2619320 RepID=UPI00095CCA5C|nr:MULTISPECIES: Hsp70 family protein [unclassified Pseudonocardia]OLM34348.1 General secretory system II protein E domain protein [Pseudonocardia sp. Ae717_Ps2]
MSYLLGIDLGATSVTAAVLRTGGAAESVRLGGRDGSDVLPAVLVATPGGDLLCGEPARRRAPAEPDRVARGFLDRVGDPTPLSLGGFAYAAEDLCARLVRVLVDEVSTRHGGPPSRIGVTCPVGWGRHKRDLLAAALRRRGLTVSLVTAPQAVALAHRTVVPAGGPLAVVDLGGNGTTATVLAAAAPGVLPDAVGRTLTCRTGGADVDDAVFAFVQSSSPATAAAFDALDPDDPRTVAALTSLRDECRAAKQLLSRDTVATVPVELPGLRTAVRIHRSDLDELTRPLLEPVTDLVQDVVAAAPDAEVLLAGGAARMPVVVQAVSAALGRPVAVVADPVADAARGAALAVAPGAGTSWPGVRMVPLAGVPTPREPVDPAGRSPWDRPGPDTVDRAGSTDRTDRTTPAWPTRGERERTARTEAPAADRTAVALLDPEPPTGPLTAVPRTRTAQPPAPARPSVLGAGRVTAPAIARPERPAPDTLVTRDAPAGAARRGVVTRQRLMVGAGGLAGAAAIAGALLFWPTTSPGIGELSAAPVLSSPAVAPAPVAPGAAPAPGAASGPVAGAPVGGTRAGASGGAATGGVAARPAAGAAAPAAPGAPAPAAPAPAAPAPAVPSAPVVSPPPATSPPATSTSPNTPAEGTSDPATPPVTTPPATAPTTPAPGPTTTAPAPSSSVAPAAA